MIGIPAVSGAIVVEECCGEAFQLDDVVAFAKEVGGRRGDSSFILLVVPAGRKEVFSIASSSEESPGSCRDHAVALQRSVSHAFVFRTTAGFSVHHWNHRKAEYRRVVVSGRDLYDVTFAEGARLALVTPMWDGVRGDRPHLKIVVPSVLAREPVLRVAREVMAAMGITSATVIAREDGYFWPGACYPYSLPIQWRAEASADPLSPRAESIFCRIGMDGKKDECVVLRAGGGG
jgi:hypothetical protein